MLKTLRRKFVLAIMALTGAVLIVVLGGSYVSAWHAQHDIVYEALERGINDNMHGFGRLSPDATSGPAPDEGRRANVLVLVMDLNDSGVVLSTNDTPLVVDSDVLADTLEEALVSDNDTCWDESTHLAWQRVQRESGAWRVVLADTSAVDISLHTLAVRDLAIVLVAMAALLLIAVGLSRWMVKPVEQAWDQQRRFVADASHELKTPLAVIIVNTQILQANKELPADAQRWVKSTADESSHMKSLVEELLELARTDETSFGTQGIMQQEPVDFSALVENAALEFDAIAFERGCSIEESIAQGAVVKGDREWLERLAKILIDNACKYSYAGNQVTVSLTREGNKCRFSVNNHGDVIDPEDLAHVFDRFYRADKARSRSASTGGFGLGLAIAQGIATSHGGSISATSDETSGTTFQVTLPLSS